MAHDNLVTKTQRDCESMNILRHRFLSKAASRFCRLTEPAQIRRDHGMSLRKFRYQWPPHVAVFRVAVQQEHRVALSGDQVVEPDSVDARETILDTASAPPFSNRV